ncbi:MAG: adenosylcobinamide-phosphate synthase CbiB [Cyanophyceae cyanobacterium]
MVLFEEWRNLVTLALAAGLDYLIGDPWGWLHPVQVMGWEISRLTRLSLKTSSPGWQRRLAGIGLGTVIIIGSGFTAWALVQTTAHIHADFGTATAVVMLASCFAGRSLRLAALDVLKPLEAGDIDEARSKLSLYVGRDTEKLTEAEILRAVLETVAENTTDGVTAPLFYAAVGLLIPGLGSAPVAIAYKAASTLDSTIGYRQDPYTDLGWFSARLEDVITWLPCRLTVLTIALLARKPRQVWRLCRRDAVKDPSPNSGWSECAFAAALAVQLGGVNTYGGVVKHKPLLGEPHSAITPQKVNQALQLTRTCFLLWLASILAVALIYN